MALKDHLPKLSKEETDQLNERIARQFFEDFEDFQRKHYRRLAAVVVHDLKGSHVEFTLVPFEESPTP